MVGETQPEMELLEIVTFIYPLSLKAGRVVSSATKCAVLSFSLKTAGIWPQFFQLLDY